MSAQKVSAALVLLAVAWSATAGCVLPVPDGSDKAPPKPNLVGEVVTIKPNALLIRRVNSAATIQVETGASTTYTKHHGGWLRRGDLQPGHQVWVWYKDCQAPHVGQPQVAYLRLIAGQESK
jgi:hypothetical protein